MSNHLLCFGCKKTKSLTEFYIDKTTKRGYRNKCKACYSLVCKEWWRSNKKLATQNRKAQAVARRNFLNTQKNKPCIDCGQTFPPYVMDFDHVKGEKLRIVSEMYRWSMQKLKKEITKCEVVCANCHRIRTHTQGLT